MSIAFPPIRPSSRNVQTGRFPVKVFNAINGTSVTRLFGSKRSNSSLQLTFTGLSDKDLKQILDCYDKAYGSYDVLILPNEVWIGFNDEVRLQLQSYYQWRFNDAPTIATPFQGVFNVTVSLIGTLSSS